MTSTREKELESSPADHVYVCSICEKIQTSVLDMRQHIKQHKPFQCENCLKKFTSNQQLRNHFKSIHSKSEFPCPLCKKTFCHIRYLEQHVKVHSAIKRFVCNICEKQFTQLVHLKSHSATHLTKKPHPCNICKKEFSCKSSLFRHHQSHSNKDNFICKHCNKRFSRKDSLVIHIQVIHELKKNHKCNECKLAFSQKSSLKGHYKKVHLTPEMKLDETSKSEYLFKKEIIPDMEVTFSVSILKPNPVKNTTDKCLEKKNQKLPNIILTNKTDSVQEKTLDDEDSLPELEPIKFETDKLDSENEKCLTKQTNENGAVPSENDLRNPFCRKQWKCQNNTLTLFSNSDVCEILDPTPESLEADFLLDSLGVWENGCQLEHESLPTCSMDSDLVPDEYFSSLQCSMPFPDLQS